MLGMCLNVGPEELSLKIRHCMHSCFSPRQETSFHLKSRVQESSAECCTWTSMISSLLQKLSACVRRTRNYSFTLCCHAWSSLPEKRPFRYASSTTILSVILSCRTLGRRARRLWRDAIAPADILKRLYRVSARSHMSGVLKLPQSFSPLHTDGAFLEIE